MSSHNLVISPLSQNDLKRIYQYGVRNWGAVQAADYLELLKNCLWNLTEQPKIGIAREGLLPNMRSLPVESHVVFYRLQNRQIEIVRILHGRQDPQRHIR
ncbi:MAG: type II toxin-antitoxin system RelE/ParE family toxin [Sedimenticola sp.]